MSTKGIVPRDGSLPADDKQCDRLRTLLDNVKRHTYYLRAKTNTRTLYQGGSRTVAPAPRADSDDIAELASLGYVDTEPYSHRESRVVEGETTRTVFLLVRITAEGGELLYRLHSRQRTGNPQPKRLWSKPTGGHR